MKPKTFTSSEWLPLEHLKHARLPLPANTGMKRDLPPQLTEEAMISGKDWIANLLVPEKDKSADFERAFVKRGAERFAEWVEKELEK